MPESERVSVTIRVDTSPARLSMDRIRETAVYIAQEIRLRWLEAQRWEDDGGPCV